MYDSQGMVICLNLAKIGLKELPPGPPLSKSAGNGWYLLWLWAKPSRRVEVLELVSIASSQALQIHWSWQHSTTTYYMEGEVLKWRHLDYAQIGWISYVAYKINFKHQPLMHEWVWLFIGKIRVIFGQFYHQTIRVCFPLTGTDQNHLRLIFRPMAR